MKELQALAESQALKIAKLSAKLERKMNEKISQVRQLKRFFSPQVAELIASVDPGNPLKSHRKEVTVVFVDLRGFTAFAESAAPEEVMEVLNAYHHAIGSEALGHGGTIGQIAGDGVMVFFNAPADVPNHAEQAIRYALAVRVKMQDLLEEWGARGHTLNYGAGIATGEATIGTVGFEGYRDYTVIGTVTNLASRLCARAKGGQILLSMKCLGPVEHRAKVEPVGRIGLRGIRVPVKAFNILRLSA
jgi:class 3 adenylate cyclase